jgi:putative ABC transport system permease protein
MDLRHAARLLLRAPGFSLLVIATFALGIGATTTLFSAVWAVFLRPLAVAHQDRLVTVWQTDARTVEMRQRIVPADFADWRELAGSFEALGALPNWAGQPWVFNVATNAGVERVNGIYASSGFFSVMSVAPLVGDVLSAEDDRIRGRRSVVISHAYWQRHFGGAPDVVGRTIDVDTFRGGAFTVVGVMPPAFDMPRGVDLWLSLADWGGGPMPDSAATHRCCAWYTVVGRLKPGVTLSAATAELNAIARDLTTRYGGDASRVTNMPRIEIEPLRRTVAGGDTATLIGILAAVGSVLLIGCANVANLLLSRGVSRRREVATRLALGATRWRLAQQLLAESTILAIIGGGAGLLLTLWAQGIVTSTLSERLPYIADMRIDLAVAAFCVALTFAVSLVCGLVPLVDWQAVGWNARGQTESPGSRRVRHLLVVSQVAIAVLVVGTAGLLIKTVSNLRAVDVGFATERTLIIKTDLTASSLRERGASARFVHDAVERLGGIPGVTAVGATTGVPFESGPAGQPITREGDPVRSQQESPQVVHTAVTPEYFRAMGIALERGRTFGSTDRADGRLVAVINQTAARRYWAGEDPIGKRFAVGSRERFGSFRAVQPGEIEWREIVGVVGDIRSSGFARDVQPEVFYSTQQFPLYDPSFVIRSAGGQLPTLEALRAALTGINPRAVIVSLRTLDEIADRSIADPRLRAAAATACSVAALLLGTLGIYGLMGYTVTQQYREIGIRAALGASRARIARLIVGKAMVVTGAGAALGLLCAAVAARWLSSLFFGIGLGDLIILPGACVVLLLAAAIAAAVPARRALDVDPAIALRSE